MRRRILTGVLLAVGLAGFVAGQETSVQWTVYAPGTTPCSTWTEQRKAGTGDPASRAWVAGFLSAANYYQAVFPDTFAPVAVLGVDDQATWLDGYCASHPSDVLVVAARALLNDLVARARK